MCRLDRFSNIAYDNALKSKLNFKHGAVITKGSKIIVSGRNYGERTKILGQIHSCIHAEIDVANQLINRYIRKKTTNKFHYNRYLKKYIIWVVRAPTDKKNQVKREFRNSIPCKMCISKLMSLGFNKIAYSDNNGNIIIQKLNLIKNNVYTSSQKRYKHHFK